MAKNSGLLAGRLKISFSTGIKKLFYSKKLQG
jgi:hypothetical protein